MRPRNGRVVFALDAAGPVVVDLAATESASEDVRVARQHPVDAAHDHVDGVHRQRRLQLQHGANDVSVRRTELSWMHLKSV